MQSAAAQIHQFQIGCIIDHYTIQVSLRMLRLFFFAYLNARIARPAVFRIVSQRRIVQIGQRLDPGKIFRQHHIVIIYFLARFRRGR